MPSPSRLFNVDRIVSNGQAFAALNKEGTVLCWGSSADGGDASTQSSKLVNITQVVGVRGDSSSGSAFAALRDDETVVAWGSTAVGGDSSSIAASLHNVTGIYASGYASAAWSS